MRNARIRPVRVELSTWPSQQWQRRVVDSIWRESDPEKPHPSAAFSYPALSRDNKGRDNVATTNYNLAAGSYRYCLTFGLILSGGRILKIDNDPRIKN